MKTSISILAVVMIVAISLVASSASGVQTLTKNDLSSFVGAACCKSATESNAGCTGCTTTGTNASYECANGSQTTCRKCLDGTPDGCTMSGTVSCGPTKYTYGNEDCSGAGTKVTGTCSKKAASGTVCD